jgi:hypothetical protein
MISVDMLNEYDWEHVFAFASGEHAGNSSPPACPEWVEGDVHKGVADAASREDVVEVIAWATEPEEPEGYVDQDWWIVAKLKDGRYLYITAGCDTTGWGCQDGGRSYCATSLPRLLMAITPEERTRLKLANVICTAHEDCLECEELARACAAAQLHGTGSERVDAQSKGEE